MKIKQRIGYFIFILLFTVSLSSCYEPDYGSGTTYVSGVVKDNRTGLPIDGLTVRFLRLKGSARYSAFDSVKTDVNGVYKYVFDAEKTATYKIASPLYTIYALYSQSLNSGENNVVNMDLNHWSTLRVRLQNKANTYQKVEIDVPKRIFVKGNDRDTVVYIPYNVPDAEVKVNYFLFKTLTTEIPDPKFLPITIARTDTTFMVIPY